MRIRWTPVAAADLKDISDYLEEHHPSYRDSTIRKLHAGIRDLRRLPERGRPGRRRDTRELLFLPLPYVVVYRISGQTVQVLRIYHGAQERS